MYTNDKLLIYYDFITPDYTRYLFVLHTMSPPSYLAPFQPEIYVFEKMCGKVKYTSVNTLDDVKKSLSGFVDNSAQYCMQCLQPPSGSSQTVDSQCEPTWLNFKEPTVDNKTLQEYQINLINKIFESALPSESELGTSGIQSTTTLETDYTTLVQSYNNPDSLYNLQQAVKKACETGIDYGDDEKPADSVFTLLQSAITTNELNEISNIDSSTKIQYSNPPSTEPTTVPEFIYNGISYYTKERNQFNNIIHNIVTANKTLNDTIVNNYKTITALQKKIDLAYQVLQAEGNKLHELTHSYANARAQTEQNRHNRVAIGFPYMDPMFTMSQRNYVIMMLCFIVMLVVGILVYAFVGRKRHTGDVVGTTSGSGAATTTTGQ